MPRMMPFKKALEMIMLGDAIGADEAKTLGLVNRVVPPEQLAAETEAFLAKLKGLSPLVLRKTRDAVYAGLDKPVPDALAAIEKIYLDELMPTADAEEGLKSFLEKRKPDWKNK
jgi:cyclohexa-1,5-dienecarbonyl-CoA hydratase